MTTLLVRDSIKYGWNTFKSRPWFFVGTALVIGIVQVVLSNIQKELPMFIGVLISVIGSTLLYCGVLNLYLRSHDDAKAARYSDLWNPKPFWKYLGISILLGLIVGIGLILLIVPGIILALVFFLSGYLVIDKGLNPIRALKESARLTKGNRWKLFLLLLAAILIMIIGFIALFVGILVAAPVVAIASVHAYRVLSGAAAAPVEVVEEVVVPVA